MKKLGLYNSSFEHDACGIGAVVNIKGKKSHDVIDNCLEILENLKHRGGIGVEENTGDGAGILMQIPHEFFQKKALDNGLELPKSGDYAVGTVFLPMEKQRMLEAKHFIEEMMKENSFNILFWREVPVSINGIGETALKAMPKIMQLFIRKPKEVSPGMDFERSLYMLRRKIEKKLNHVEGFYIASLSSRTIVYKGMLVSTQVRTFFEDLNDEDMKSAIAMVHSRYSTNTFPSWEKAHPNRMIIHNGEINTLRGNVNKIYAREGSLTSEVFGEELKEVLPIINKEGSDSATLDNVLEFIYMGGKDIVRSMLMLVPEAWERAKRIDKEKKAFYKYNSTIMEPWDGPASIVFTDGEKVGAILDRNGLRPSRYCITDDGFFILSSETGALNIPEEKIIKKDRLSPGKILLVDTVQGKLMEDDEVKKSYIKSQPYERWIDENLITLKSIEVDENISFMDEEERLKYQKIFGYGYEDLKSNIYEMAQNQHEAIAAMGIDTPLAVLSSQSQPLFNYFKQLFAQVTNPPIDAIREELMTSTNVYLGSKGSILEDKPENCHQIEIMNPIISNKDLLKIKSLDNKGYRIETIDIVFNKTKGEKAMEEALDNVCRKVYNLATNGVNIIIISDRAVNEESAPIPALLAVSAVNSYLVKKGVRSLADIIVESAEPREVHHFATLLGFGATAVNPYLAYETIKELVDEKIITTSYEEAINNYDKAIIKGITKILSKMGISTIRSYQGAQIFEAVGINNDVVNKYFPNTISRIGGLSIYDIEKEVLLRHDNAFDIRKSLLNSSLDNFGRDKLRMEGEKHLYNPETIHKLQVAVRSGDYKLYKEYSKAIVKAQEEINLRGLLDFNYSETPIPLAEVESVDSIVKRFKSGAMSYGSISKEAHETLAIAMNRLGGRSNTGEGGEDKERWIRLQNGDSKRSAIKQIASGRFGVTSEYLVNADEIQIKVAQGAKPGEGGQLPSKKVYPWIAKTRNSTTGVGLISPPPHHDIYSIEDLAQLIYDLKNANIYADVSVKLVAEGGVGTVAAGVAKGGADIILISGYDGGTGAAPKTSIQNAGVPWELGLAEAQQTLVANNLRSRVMLEADGKLMSGRDVAIAALLGAEGFGFATAPLVALGCVMMRVCNQDTCPVGIATQNEKLRKNFTGKPEYVVNFMRFIAEELREYMAALGFKTVDEMVGRVDKLKVKEHISGWKASKVDLSLILEKSQLALGNGIRFEKDKSYDHKLDEVKDNEILKVVKPSLDLGEDIRLEVNVKNTDRAFGTILGSEITRSYSKIKEDSVWLKCIGTAGQSFGAFIPKGLTLEIEGDVNDYLGKGLSGGKIIAYPARDSRFKAEENILVGNVSLYGATSGEAYLNGIAGERFAVRNSGAEAVVEGCGAHGCEYMTGGRVIILGAVGENFAAGMSGGIAYVFDEDDSLNSKINREMVLVEGLDEEDKKFVKEKVGNHYRLTKSARGKMINDDFNNNVAKFKKVIPKDYKEVMEFVREKEVEGLNREEALAFAFNAKVGIN